MRECCVKKKTRLYEKSVRIRLEKKKRGGGKTVSPEKKKKETVWAYERGGTLQVLLAKRRKRI